MNYTRGKFFLDTNILVYLFSEDEDHKKKIVESVLLDLNQGNGIVSWSTQVMQEFYYVLTSKHSIPPEDVKNCLAIFDFFELIVNSQDTFYKAIDIHQIYHFSFWDSLIIAAAIQSKSEILLSEDMSHGVTIENVTIISPFK